MQQLKLDASFFQARPVTVTFPGIGPVLFERSMKARRLNISIRLFRGVRVAVPKRVSFRKAEQMVHAKMGWIRKHLVEMRLLEEKYAAKAGKTEQVDREEAGRILTARLAELAACHGFTYNRVTIRFQKTRWGSCSVKNNISLNAKLLLLPDDLRIYILLHELVHTRVKNHGKKFWAELAGIEPGARDLDARMKKYNLRLL